MIIEPKILNNVCTTAHPIGCAKEVENQINYIKSLPKIKNCRVKNALILGASGGYGLASRIALAYGCGANTLGVSFEKAATDRRTATPGWYNNKAFSEIAKKDSIEEKTLILDAFLNASKEEVIRESEKFFDGKIDIIIYSLAAPVRMDESTGTLYRSSLKPLGNLFTGTGVDFITEELSEVTIQPANEEELKATVKVMGGEDWELWTEALLKANLLAENSINIAYSYIGPEMTKSIYREGTIGKAKDNLEATGKKLNITMEEKVKGHAYVSVNKAVVTRASAVIPTIPLYVGILFKIMKEKGVHEGCIEQAYRLLNEKLYSGGEIPLDEENRIRIDDLEMRNDIQKEVSESWKKINKDTLKDLADLKTFRKDYMNLHGFEVNGIDYSKDVEI